MVCGGCGTELRDGAKFCDECGAAVSRAAAVAEYKQVTVLFADVVHSMDIAAAVGPERLREVMSEVFDRCCEVVQRYDGTVDKFTGDGVMAVFGAPISLEDHAIRACMAAMDIQRRAGELAVEANSRDGIELQLRVGLNSGEVIAGEVGSRTASYTTIGDQVGMAQRMESVATPGGVMLSESTARLVEGDVVLSDRRLVPIKGADQPVPGYELLSVTGRRPEAHARAGSFVGREWETTVLTAMLNRAANGHGGVVGLVGPPGIGKSRLVAETASRAVQNGLTVFSTYCESHTSDVPFQVATRLLRSALGIDGLDDDAAREVIRTQAPGVHPTDLTLLFDELGIRDVSDKLPDIAPEARRRRLSAVVNAHALSRSTPAMYIVEDAHWIDPTSESLLADFLAVVPRASALVLITYRPEYTGALSRSAGAQTVALAPLEDSETNKIVLEFLGSDSSVQQLGVRISERASGNPFFAGEIMRDLVGRGVLSGERGAYTCDDEAFEVTVPATLHAAIAARIDRLEPRAKRTLNAAAVIGLRFDEALLHELTEDLDVDSLRRAELVDQVTFAPRAEYAFHHPLIRSVAYQSQLRSDRAELHRRLATAIETRHPESADDNAALIAEHLDAAGDLRAAFAWHMRAGGWLTFRDIVAARLSWQRARDVADRLPPDAPDRDATRIAPRTLLCASAFRVGSRLDDGGYEELCVLTAAVDDKVSLATATAGQVAWLTFGSRFREAAALATEMTSLIDAIGDPVLAVTQLPIASMAKLMSGEVAEALRVSEQVIEMSGGDRYMGNLIVESPLTVAVALRAAARMLRGELDWKRDMREAVADAREFTPIGEAVLVTWFHGVGVAAGVFRADAASVRETADIFERVQQSADDLNVECARFLRGFALARQTGAERARGLEMLAAARRTAAERRSLMAFSVIADVELAREMLESGDVDAAIDRLAPLFDEVASQGGLLMHARTGEFLVEALLARGTQADVVTAREVVARIEAAPVEPGVVLNELSLLRARALLARSQGDESSYRQLRDAYRARAYELGFEGHIDIAEAMAD